ncbi:MAG: RNA polymerase sigma factor [Tunicatimonas sp.]|uniref:RNA polymerase sigma factor n=1 Tax=Tunicatimonas sp. TaxID=1940096 RepID=UPI003C711328
MRVFTKSHTYQTHLPFKPWLHKIISNRCTDHIKQDKTNLHQEISSKIADTIEEEIDTESVIRPTTEILEDLLEKVSGRSKLILTLKYKQHWSIREIAQTLNLNENTVKSHLKRTREELQKLLEQYSNSFSQ